MTRTLALVVAVLALPAAAAAQECTSSCTTTSSNKCPNTQACVCTASPRWQTATPVQWSLYNHASGIDGVSFATLESGVKAAFDSWGLQSCSKLRFSYQGVITPTPSSPNAAINANDGKNQLAWISAGWTYGSATLGVTHAVWTVGSNAISDADIEFNDFQKTWSTTGAPNTIDFQSIATHESGHFWGATHSPSAAAVMYYAYSGGLKRTPAPDDVGQLCCLYPSTAATGSQGDFCQTGSNCQSGLICAKPSSGGDLICTKACTPGGAACPTSYGCGSATTVPAAVSANACFITPTAPSDLCAFCESGTECSSGLCLRATPYSFCSATCTSAAQCGAGFECVGISGTGGGTSQACAPIASAQGRICPAAKAQCTGAKACPTYYHCESTGMCRGGLQDESCALENCASTANTCLAETDQDICRKNCTTSANCPAGQICFGLTGSMQKVCSVDPNASPDGGTPGADAGATAGRDAGPLAGSCQTCSPTLGCAAGYDCLYDSSTATTGTCYKKCATNTDCPSTSVCYWSATSTSAPEWCACPNELAARDQPCGGATNLACTQSDNCVAAQGSRDYRCRKRCAVDTDCPGGRCAQLGGGGGACLPAAPVDGGTASPPDASASGTDAQVIPGADVGIAPGRDAAVSGLDATSNPQPGLDAAALSTQDAAGGDDGGTTVANGTESGCGCSASGGEPMLLLAMGAVCGPLLRRRRR